ncbi:unnamed protein product [Microthlaspi erraticum]|uniref:Uncharacterized protein n=1 Tax=Microthlaspi erraticum TaxID=1685480 RepID=A0A6D2HI88_9BRAS|nr:unnamed protein product [Microthlaspi erraticum]
MGRTAGWEGLRSWDRWCTPSVDWRAWFSRRRKTKGPFGFEKWSIICRVSTFKPAKIVIGRFPEWPELKRSRKKYLVDRSGMGRVAIVGSVVHHRPLTGGHGSLGGEKLRDRSDFDFGRSFVEFPHSNLPKS